MAIESIDLTLGLDTFPTSVGRGADCLAITSITDRYETSVAAKNGIGPPLQPMVAGFAPIAESLRSYPQGTDHTGPARSTVFEGQSVVTMARVLGLDGQPLAPSTVYGIRGSLYRLSGDLGTRRMAVSSTSLDPEKVLRGRLIQGDPRWQSAGGFNFEHVWPGADFVGGGRTYRLEYEVAFQARGQAQVARVIHEVALRSVLSSGVGE